MRNAGRLARISLVSLVVSLVAAPLHAQPAAKTGGAFVDGFATAVWDDARDAYTHVGGAVPGYGMSLGVDYGKSGIEIDAHVPQWHTQN